MTAPSSDIETVRLFLGETADEPDTLSDEQLGYLIDRWLPDLGDLMLVAASVCELKSVRFAGQVAISADGGSIAMDQLQDKYEKAAATLRAAFKRITGRTGAFPYVGNLDPAWMRFGDEPPMFGTGMHDNPEAGRQDYGDFNGGRGAGPYRDPAWADGYGA